MSRQALMRSGAALMTWSTLVAWSTLMAWSKGSKGRAVLLFRGGPILHPSSARLVDLVARRWPSCATGRIDRLDSRTYTK